MGKRNPDDHSVSIPVDDVDALARHLDSAADDMETSMRRLRADSNEAHLNDADDGLSRSRLDSRMLSVFSGLKRTTAQLRGTAALAADTAARALAADEEGSPLAVADEPSPPVNQAIDRLSAGVSPVEGDQARPGWEQVWEQATDGADPR